MDTLEEVDEILNTGRSVVYAGKVYMPPLTDEEVARLKKALLNARNAKAIAIPFKEENGLTDWLTV